jgi:hypothetical protein
MQAGRALDVLFDTQAATARGGPAAPRQAGVGYKRLRDGSATSRQYEGSRRVMSDDNLGNSLPPPSFGAGRPAAV